MKTMHLIFLFMLSLAYSQVATATNVIWLKVNNTVCTNSGITNPANPGKIVGLGDASSGSMTIDNPSVGTKNCPTIPTTTSAVTFSGFTTDTVQINMLKPGTNGNLECLDQGNNLSGMHGTVTSGGYTLTLGFSYTNGCTLNPLPIFNRAAMLTGGMTTFNGTYHVYNTSTVPEPGTIMLLLAGLFGLATMSWIKRGKSQPTPFRG